MAKKEQRILIDVINPGINCVYRLDNDPKGQSLCKHNGNMEPVTAKECRHCDEGMTREEAIDTMCEGWNKLREQINADKEHAHCCSNKMIMEAALNALLEKGE